MAGTVIADRLEAQSTSQLVIENGVALTPPTIVDVNGVQIGTFCRAWVNFQGTGTVTIRSSFNVSSVTDDGTGLYTINFTNAMPDANYAVSGAAQYGTGFTNNNKGEIDLRQGTNPTQLTTACPIYCSQTNGVAPVDMLVVTLAIFR